jgi:membrane protease YdiL (CAAX protease family)
LRAGSSPWFHSSVASAKAWDIWLILLFLGVIVPWRGHVRLKHLVAKSDVSSRERIYLYLSTTVFQWMAAAVTGWRAWSHGFGAKELGLVTPDLGIIAAGLVGAGGFATFQWFNLRRAARAGTRTKTLRNLARAIMPQSKTELVPFLGLALTAGICEEFLYRGFAIAVLASVGLPNWLIVVGSASLFGLAHLYQGRSGLIGTMILGIAFGAMRIAYASLLPVVLWHAAVDVAAGIAGPRFLLATDATTEDLSANKSIS